MVKIVRTRIVNMIGQLGIDGVDGDGSDGGEDDDGETRGADRKKSTTADS